MAIGHLHVSLASPRAAVPDSLHGRPLTLRGVARAGASPAVGAGDGGPGAWHRRVWGARGDSDGPGTPVHGLAWRNRLRAGTTSSGDTAYQEPPAAPADGGQSRAILEDPLGGVSVAHRVCGLRGLREADRALHRWIQLPPPAPGHCRAGAGRSILSSRAARARSHREERRAQRAAARERAAPSQALLLGGAPGQSRSDDRRLFRRAARADGERRTANDSHAEGDRR